MSDFQKALDFVLRWETVFEKGHHGDYDFAIAENDPDDPGGITKFGLDARTHGPEVARLTVEEAGDIYSSYYWLDFGCDVLPWPVNLVAFDSTVNVGKGQTTRFFQRLAGSAVDGAWGPNTSAAVGEWIVDVGAEVAALSIVHAREDFYKDLAQRKPAMAKFLRGWLNRTQDLKKEFSNGVA